jgi:hypothetical protein
VAHRLALATVISLVLWASCSLPRPGVELSISGVTVPPSRESSFCQSGGCGGMCGDGPAPVAPLTSVRTTTPVHLDFAAGSDVNQIHGDIWQGETIAGTPIESFTLTGSMRSYTTTELKPGGRYYVFVMIGWSRLLDRGDSSRAFLIEIAPP